MTTTPDTGRTALARLIVQARHSHHWSQDDLATAASLGAKTITNIETAAHPPRPSSLAKVERALGLIPGSLTDVLNHHAPETVTLDQITDTTSTNTTQAGDLTDAELIWELTQRLQTRTAELERLRTTHDTPAPPADAYTLAADLDRSGHGRHLAHEADQAGEEDQT